MHPDPARVASCARLSPSPWSEKEWQHQATLALLWFPQPPFLPSPALKLWSFLPAAREPITPCDSQSSQRAENLLAQHAHTEVLEGAEVLADTLGSLPACEQEEHRQPGMVQGQGTISHWGTKADAAVSTSSQP